MRFPGIWGRRCSRRKEHPKGGGKPQRNWKKPRTSHRAGVDPKLAPRHAQPGTGAARRRRPRPRPPTCPPPWASRVTSLRPPRASSPPPLVTLPRSPLSPPRLAPGFPSARVPARRSLRELFLSPPPLRLPRSPAGASPAPSAPPPGFPSPLRSPPPFLNLAPSARGGEPPRRSVAGSAGTMRPEAAAGARAARGRVCHCPAGGSRRPPSPPPRGPER